MKATRYVLCNERGEFYWNHSSISSFYGFSKDFDRAFLFKTRGGAEKRSRVVGGVVMEVELVLK